MNNLLKIGIQGDLGSNAEAAAYQYLKENNITTFEILPLIDSATCVSYLKKGRVDRIVVAARNSTAGTVKETYDAIKDEYLELKGTVILQIHHALFKLPDTPETGITAIGSHIQALKQTENFRQKHYPDCRTFQCRDTAKAAKDLKEGKIPADCAVICRKSAGEKYGLELVRENIEDNSNNQTEFRIFSKPTLNYENQEPPTLKEMLRYHIVADKNVGFMVKLFVILANVAAIVSAQFWDSLIVAIIAALGIDGATLLLLFTSSSLKNHTRYKTLEGYWKYYSLTDNEIEDDAQKFSVPRLVHIEELDGKLKITGVISDHETVPFFESTKVVVSPIERQENTMVYWYRTPIEGGKRVQVAGIADMTWRSRHPAASVNKMEGHYHGINDKGTLTYLRITEEEYKVHTNSIFL